MTVLTSETSVLVAGARLPRVNLLPPEIAAAKKMRKVQLGLGAAGVCAVALVGGLYLQATSSVSSAQSSLDNANSQTTTLRTQIAKYGDVTATRMAAEAAQKQLATAMGDEVRYSQLLTDLSLSVPSTVWLKTLAYAAPASANPNGAPAAATTTTAGGAGTFTVTGTAYSHDDVALWLEALARLKTYANPYFTNSTEALIGQRRTVNFSSSADVTPAARSNRYVTPGS